MEAEFIVLKYGKLLELNCISTISIHIHYHKLLFPLKPGMIFSLCLVHVSKVLCLHAHKIKARHILWKEINLGGEKVVVAGRKGCT